jgi:hypothetical protein
MESYRPASVVSQKFVYELNEAFDFCLRSKGQCFLGRSSARLKPCPDTNRVYVTNF